jgi:hypothetical protein
MTVSTWGARLRRDLAERAKAFAVSEAISCYPSLGAVPTMLFPVDPDGRRHGNFIDESYRAMLAEPS